MEAPLPPSGSPIAAPPSSHHHNLIELRASYELMHRHLLKSMDAYAIVLSILLTSSYCGFLQFPKSLDGFHPPNSSNFQKLFMYTNGFSFFSSVAGLLLFASSSFSPLLALDFGGLGSAEKEVEKRVQLLAHMLPKFFYVILFFGVSLTCLVFAYIFAGLSTVTSAITEELAVILTAVIGGVIYLQALWVCAHDAYQLLKGSIRQNKKLWDALKKGTLFGLWLANYVDFVCGDAAVKNQSKCYQNTPSDTEPNGPSS